MLGLCLLVFGDPPLPFDPTPFDKTIPIEIAADGPILSGHGRAGRAMYTADFGGTLHIWTSCAAGIDPFLRVSDQDGRHVGEDDAQGDHIPYLRMEVENGRRFQIDVAIPADTGTADVELHLVAAPESDATRAAASAARVAMKDVAAARAAGDSASARSQLSGVYGDLIGVPNGGDSDALCDTAWELLDLAWTVGNPSIADALRERIFRHCARTLPVDHPRRLMAASRFAGLMWKRGDVPGGALLARSSLELLEKRVPADDLGLQRARIVLSGFLQLLSNDVEALRLLEQVLPVFERALPADHPDRQDLRFGLARSLTSLGDLVRARSFLEEAREIALRTGPDNDPELLRCEAQLALVLRNMGELSPARTMQERIVAVAIRDRGEEHMDVANARQILDLIVKAQGDWSGALELERQVIATYSRNLPENSEVLLGTRSNMATTMEKLGDLKGAHAELLQIDALCTRDFPRDHPLALIVRSNLATTLNALGETRAAREMLEPVRDSYERTLPPDDKRLLDVLQNLAVLYKEEGNLVTAREMEGRILASRLRTMPEDAPEVLDARQNLGATLRSDGLLEEAASLFRTVYEVRSRTLPELSPERIVAGWNMAATFSESGLLPEALVLSAHVLRVLSEQLPDDHPDLQQARMNHGVLLLDSGDLIGARTLLERALEVLSSTMPDDHSFVQLARFNLAVILERQKDYAGALKLMQKVIEVQERRGEGEALASLSYKTMIATCLLGLGDAARAEAMLSSAIAASSSLPAGCTQLLSARQDLALALKAQGHLVEARTIEEETLRLWRASPQPPLRLAALARTNLISTLVGLGDAEAATALSRDLLKDMRSRLEASIRTSSAREASSLVPAWRSARDSVVSLAGGYGSFPADPVLDGECALASEALRGLDLVVARMQRSMGSSQEVLALRRDAVSAASAVARLADEPAKRDELAAAVTRLDDAQRALSHEYAQHADVQALMDWPVESTVRSRLAETDAVVSFHRYRRYARSPKSPTAPEQEGDCLLAWVWTAGASPVRVELGAIEPVELAVEAWRAAAGGASNAARGLAGPPDRASPEADARTAGRGLVQLVWIPLARVLKDKRRVIVVPDDVLHLVAFDALPSGEGVIGDQFEIQSRLTVRELAWPERAAQRDGVPLLVGGADFDAGVEKPVATVAGANVADLEATQPAMEVSRDTSPDAALATLLRGGEFEHGFPPLSGTLREVEAIAALWGRSHDARDTSILLTGSRAARESLEEQAPRARYLHIATHGWFAPNLVAGDSGGAALDPRSGLSTGMTRTERVRGASPMVLCGIALAGANRASEVPGIPRALVTAAEVATWDLGHCDLAVLSACETNLGERSAGQGIASMQKALHMAGARTVVTSLWKVPDEATRELMTRFYEKLWVEHMPVARAFWTAKCELRAARDPSGAPRFGPRDWAGWVLTGAPD